jgi:hypothetical protein
MSKTIRRAVYELLAKNNFVLVDQESDQLPANRYEAEANLAAQKFLKEHAARLADHDTATKTVETAKDTSNTYKVKLSVVPTSGKGGPLEFETELSANNLPVNLRDWVLHGPCQRVPDVGKGRKVAVSNRRSIIQADKHGWEELSTKVFRAAERRDTTVKEDVSQHKGRLGNEWTDDGRGNTYPTGAAADPDNQA